MLDEVEHDAAKINDNKDDGQIGDEQIGYFTAGHPADDDRYTVDTPGDRN